MTKTLTLIEQRAALASKVESATAAVTAAHDREKAQRFGSDAGVDFTADIRDFIDAIAWNRPDATPPEDRASRHLELTKQLGEAVVEAGLVFQPMRTATGFGLVVVDPSVQADVSDALAAKFAAERAVRDFDAKHGEQYRAEQKAAEAEAIREAYEGDDPDALRDLLERRAEADQSAREATADALVSGVHAGWDDRDEIRRSGELAAPTGALTTAG